MSNLISYIYTNLSHYKAFLF